jgi:hypothetical protein
LSAESTTIAPRWGVLFCHFITTTRFKKWKQTFCKKWTTTTIRKTWSSRFANFPILSIWRFTSVTQYTVKSNAVQAELWYNVYPFPRKIWINS